jgi:hypothetical protein
MQTPSENAGALTMQLRRYPPIHPTPPPTPPCSLCLNDTDSRSSSSSAMLVYTPPSSASASLFSYSLLLSPVMTPPPISPPTLMAIAAITQILTSSYTSPTWPFSSTNVQSSPSFPSVSLVSPVLGSYSLVSLHPLTPPISQGTYA